MLMFVFTRNACGQLPAPELPHAALASAHFFVVLTPVGVLGRWCLACNCRPNREFWMSLGVVCDDKVAKAKELLGETEEGVATGGLHKVCREATAPDWRLQLFDPTSVFM